MQMLIVENIALTFLDDAVALATGFARLVVKTVTAPIERIARASDVAGVLPSRERGLFSARCPFSFRHLKHLT